MDGENKNDFDGLDENEIEELKKLLEIDEKDAPENQNNIVDLKEIYINNPEKTNKKNINAALYISVFLGIALIASIAYIFISDIFIPAAAGNHIGHIGQLPNTVGLQNFIAA